MHVDTLEDLQHRDGIRWHAAPIPPPEHECWPQSHGWLGLTQIERCPCGAVRRNGRAWFQRNTRTGGTA